MANNYTQYSFIVASDLTEEEQTWIRDYIQDKQDNDFNWYTEADIETDRHYKTGELVTSLWVWASESGDIESAVAITRDFLAAHRPNEVVGFEWSESCSKPRLGEFGGGAVVITAKESYWMTTSEWVRDKLAELENYNPS